MATSNFSSTTRSTVVGYFSNGEDAARAIDDLIAEGFRPSEIGAAFHTGSTAQSSVSRLAPVSGDIESGSTDMDFHPAAGLNSPNAGTSMSGAGSDSNAVTPAGLSTGGGTATSGVTRPGPIPGAEIPSSIPSTLRHTIPSTLPSTLHPAGTARAANENFATRLDSSATGDFYETQRSGGANWWEKLKHVFSSNDANAEKRSPGVVADKRSTHYGTGFGTGEGQLGISPDEGYAYSGRAFESAFFGMGVAPTHARQLSGKIYRGGAIVTVESGELNKDAEKILERNGGSVREETISGASSLASEEAWSEANQAGRVQLFGKVQQVYPGYVSSTGETTRKAS